jgi:hypothetical protein
VVDLVDKHVVVALVGSSVILVVLAVLVVKNLVESTSIMCKNSRTLLLLPIKPGQQKTDSGQLFDD